MTYLASARKPRVPKAVHPIDSRAQAVREAAVPRQALADAIDEILGDWSMGGLATPPVTVLDHLRTLCLACIETEEREERNRSMRRSPVADPWKEMS